MGCAASGCVLGSSASSMRPYSGSLLRSSRSVTGAHDPQTLKPQQTHAAPHAAKGAAGVGAEKCMQAASICMWAGHRHLEIMDGRLS